MTYFRTPYTEEQEEVKPTRRANKKIAVIGFPKQEPQERYLHCLQCNNNSVRLLRINGLWVCPNCEPSQPVSYEVTTLEENE